MANQAHFFRRSAELGYVKDLMSQLDREIGGFIQATNSLVRHKASIELDSQKMQEVDRDLQQLETYILDYKDRLRRISRVKVRHWERPQLTGQAGDIVGDRRAIDRKLNRALDRIRRIRQDLSLVTFSNQAIMVEQVGNQLGNVVDKGKIQPGGDWILAVTFLLAFFSELKKRRD